MFVAESSCRIVRNSIPTRGTSHETGLFIKTARTQGVRRRLQYITHTQRITNWYTHDHVFFSRLPSAISAEHRHSQNNPRHEQNHRRTCRVTVGFGFAGSGRNAESAPLPLRALAVAADCCCDERRRCAPALSRSPGLLAGPSAGECTSIGDFGG